MAILSLQPHRLELVLYPNSDAEFPVLKRGFPAGAPLTVNVLIGKGDDVTPLSAALQPEIINPTSPLSKVRLTGAKAAQYNMPDYVFEIFVGGAICTAGPLRFSRETIELIGDDVITIDRGGDKQIVVRRSGASEPILFAVDSATPPLQDRQFEHGLDCDAIVGYCFNVNGALIPGPSFRPLVGEAGKSQRNWVWLDLGGIDPDLIKFYGFVPYYA